MNYIFEYHTDVGIKKETNQDSLCVKQAKTDNGDVLMAIVCDGMGGLEKGEVASSTIINTFSKWFAEELPSILADNSPKDEIQYRWDRIIKEQNQKIAEYGRNNHIQLGSTITAMLFYDNCKFIIGHVGDSRAYHISGDKIEPLTLDQTVVANEVRQGRLTVEQAERDPRRNVLLQCIGASKIVKPDFIYGTAELGECYMLCSDGFRHVITNEEMLNVLSPQVSTDEETLKNNLIKLVELNKSREETDNISAILIKII